MQHYDAHKHLRVFAHYVLGRLAFLFFLCHPGSMATFADSKDFLQQRYPNRELLVDLTSTADDIRDIKHRQVQGRAGKVTVVCVAEALTAPKMVQVHNGASLNIDSDVSGEGTTILAKADRITTVGSSMKAAARTSEAVELMDRTIVSRKRTTHVCHNVNDDSDNLLSLPRNVNNERRRSVELVHKRRRTCSNSRGRTSLQSSSSPFASTAGLAFIRPASPTRGSSTANANAREAPITRSMSPTRYAPSDGGMTMLLGFNSKRNGSGSSSGGVNSNTGSGTGVLGGNSGGFGRSSASSSSSSTALEQGAVIGMDPTFISTAGDASMTRQMIRQQNQQQRRQRKDRAAAPAVDAEQQRPLVSALFDGALHAYDNALNLVGFVLITSPISGMLNLSQAKDGASGSATRQHALTTPASIARGAVLQDTYDLVGFMDFDPYEASGRLSRGG